MFKIMPYKATSSGARILSAALPAEIVDARQPVTIGSDCVVINWGCGWTSNRVSANSPRAVCNAVNKIKAFKLFDVAGVEHPAFTSSVARAAQWLGHGFNVYYRESMEAERGRGITVLSGDAGVDKLEELGGGNFTKGFPIHREFRVHVAFGEVIEVNEKKKRNGTNPDPLIRSHRDWVFCVYNLAPFPAIIREASIKAVAALGLDFGGVDIAIDRDSNYVVFEVNTAPWINRESSTNAYRDAFTNHFAS